MDGAGRKALGYYPAGDAWLPLRCNAVGQLEVDMTLVTLFARITTAPMIVYVDKEATGAGDGTSWTDAFTTIQAAWDSLPPIVVHDITIRVRAASTPYREDIDINSKLVVARVYIQGEFYLQGACEANVGGAGEITDTGAFADVLIGDKVLVMYEDPADSNKPNQWEVCTVDDISNIPNRIGTDGALTPTTNWYYVIVRTEISGSDDGTDPGTARDYCFKLTTINNITMRGFYYTFSDNYAIDASNSREIDIDFSIFDQCDQCVSSYFFSSLASDWCAYYRTPGYRSVQANTFAHLYLFDCAFDHDGTSAIYCSSARASATRVVISDATIGMEEVAFGNGYIANSRITAGVNIGIRALRTSFGWPVNLTNNAVTPVFPEGTTDTHNYIV